MTNPYVDDIYLEASSKMLSTDDVDEVWDVWDEYEPKILCNHIRNTLRECRDDCIKRIIQG